MPDLVTINQVLESIKCIIFCLKKKIEQTIFMSQALE